jgi:hypothetical protein
MPASAVARGALAQLGRAPVWYAVGEAVAQAMRQLPRPQLTVALSEASAAMYQVPLT